LSGALLTGTTYYAAVVRFNADGSVDSSFGNAGLATGPTVAGTSAPVSFAIAPDGTGDIVVASDSSGNEFIQVTRFTSAGKLDTSFGTGGSSTTEIDLEGGFTQDVAVQTNGAVVVTQNMPGNCGPFYSAVARFTSMGALDTSFTASSASPYKGYTDLANATDEWDVQAIAIQNGGEIIASGQIVPGPGGGASSFGTWLLTGSGAISSAFTNNAGATNIGNGGAIAMAVDPVTGSIFEAGANAGGFALQKLNGTTGAVDTTFGGGVVSTTLSGHDDPAQYGLALAADGKIVIEVAANVSQTTPEQIDVVRFTSQGTLDTSFGPTGSKPGVVADLFHSTDRYRYAGLTVQPSGGIVAAVQHQSVTDAGSGPWHLVMVRLNP
jgi:uncharacterized delta-60 repeat protein